MSEHHDVEGAPLDEIDIREIATETCHDVRTVRRAVRGEHVRGVIGAQLRRAIEARRFRREQGDLPR
jgi:hypothetical protein